MERLLTIGQFAQATSVPAHTIRSYEQVGVLPMLRRSATGDRQYTSTGETNMKIRTLALATTLAMLSRRR
jgi:DNA-binding transcriptional MerR regulator